MTTYSPSGWRKAGRISVGQEDRGAGLGRGGGPIAGRSDLKSLDRFGDGRRGRWTRRAAGSRRVAAVLSVLVLVATAQPVAAANTGPCTGAYRERHIGWDQGSGNWGGQALFTNHLLDLCTTISPTTIASSFAWVNIVNTRNSSDIVQIGVGRCRRPVSTDCNGNMTWFFAWGRESGSGKCGAVLPMPQRLSDWDGTASYYKVLREGTNWNAYIDSVLKQSIPYSWTTCAWSPSDVQFFAESWNNGDSLGGTSSSTYPLRHMSYQTSVGGAFTFVNASSCNLNDTGSSIYHCTGIGDEVDVWTAR